MECLRVQPIASYPLLLHSVRSGATMPRRMAQCVRWRCQKLLVWQSATILKQQNLCPRIPFGLQSFYAVIFRLRAERLWHKLLISARIQQSHEAKKVFFFFWVCVVESTAGICWQVGGVEPGLLLNSMSNVTKCYMATMDFAKSSRSLRLKIQHWKQ